MVSQVFETTLPPLRQQHVISWTGFPAAGSAGTASTRAQGAGRLSLRLPQANQAHLWAAWLEVPKSTCQAYKEILSAAELERASRFRFEEHRNRYIVAHGWLRQLLGAYLGRPPAVLDFEFGINGKPALAATPTTSELYFNLSHSDDLSLVAVCHRTPVGVDIERIRGMEDAAELVTRFFSKPEAAKFSALPEADKTVAFFNLWTRKEAWLKATGQGIGHLLDRIEVSFLPEEPASLLKVPEGFPDASHWSLCPLDPAAGFVGACVVAAPGVNAVCRQWNHECAEVSL